MTVTIWKRDIDSARKNKQVNKQTKQNRKTKNQNKQKQNKTKHKQTNKQTTIIPSLNSPSRPIIAHRPYLQILFQWNSIKKLILKVH